MDALMDMAWLKIVEFVGVLKVGLDWLFSPLNAVGPATAIFLIALVTVLIAKGLTRIIKTKRYAELKKEFQHWYNLRQEALKCGDSQKAATLAKNIDQAKLNKVYYDYFFEGFMLSLVTKYLPILSFMAYVGEAFSPKNLLHQYGQNYIFRFGTGAEPALIGSVFWFILSVVAIYIAWALVKWVIQKRRPAAEMMQQVI